jgi:hypothetical protein
MDIWEKEAALWQLGGGRESKPGKVAMEFAWYSESHHKELANLNPPGVVFLVRVNGQRKAATLISKDSEAVERYGKPDAKYQGRFQRHMEFPAAADQVPIGFEGNDPPP